MEVFVKLIQHKNKHLQFKC